MKKGSLLVLDQMPSDTIFSLLSPQTPDQHLLLLKNLMQAYCLDLSFEGSLHFGSIDLSGSVKKTV